MILSDYDIRHALNAGTLLVDPLDDRDIQPASVDLHLGATFLTRPDIAAGESLFGAAVDPTDPRDETGWETTDLTDLPRHRFRLPPGGFALATTVETVTLDATLVGELAGKSTLARHGLMVHTTAGWVDPGWSGQLTLELVNVTQRPLLLAPGMPIAQLVVARLASPARKPYGHRSRSSKYQGQRGPTGPAPLVVRRGLDSH